MLTEVERSTVESYLRDNFLFLTLQKKKNDILSIRMVSREFTTVYKFQCVFVIIVGSTLKYAQTFLFFFPSFFLYFFLWTVSERC